MTTIAWDGRTLAADKAGDVGSLHITVTKIWRHGPMLMAGSGSAGCCNQMREWVKSGMNPNDFPASMKDKDCNCVFFIVFPDKKVWRFESSHVPIELEDEQFAAGSGRDFALAAMHMGRDAVFAVELAAHFDPGTGRGIDTLVLHDA